MKKMLCAIMALALLSLALPALAETATASVIGTWVPYSVTMGGMPVTINANTLTFNEDGTCISGAGTETESTTEWTLTDEGLTMNGALFACSVEGDVLTLTQPETQMVMTLVREGVDPATVFTAPTGSTDPADLIGTWVLDMSAAVAGLAGAVTDSTVETPEVTWSFTFNDDGTFTIIALGQTVSGTYTVEDGVITVTATEPPAETANSFPFVVAEDGTLYLTLDASGVPMALTRQTAE